MTESKIIPTEHEENIAFVEYLELKGFLFSHIPNETFTKSWGVKMRNKQAGVRRGVPDFVVLVPGKGLCWVEMKRQKAPPSAIKPEQKIWVEELSKLKGVEARICRGAAEAIGFIEEILSK